MRTKSFVTMLDPLQIKYGKPLGALFYIPAFSGEVSSALYQGSTFSYSRSSRLVNRSRKLEGKKFKKQCNDDLFMIFLIVDDLFANFVSSC